MMLKLKSVLKRQKLACSLLFLFLIILLFLSSCASYSTLTKAAIEELEARNYSSAQEKLAKACNKQDKNQLLCLYDMGMIKYLNKDFDGAIKVWTKADELASQIDIVSVSEQGASLILDDNSVAYRGEHHEKILNSMYLALSYLQQKKYEDALVECRRINHKHNVLEQENEKKYKQNAFAKYLSGKMFEAQGEYNEAFLYYREANELVPGIGIIEDDILRLTKHLNFRQEYETFKKKFGHEAPKYDKSMGELVVILENGLSPKKVSQDLNLMSAGKFVRVVSPKYVSSYNDVKYAKIDITRDGTYEPLEIKNSRTYILNDIDLTAKEQLNDRVKIRAAKMVGRFIAKEALAMGVAKVTDNKLIGALVGMGLQAMQQADTRSWISLPSNLQIASIWLKPGEYKLKLDFYNKYDNYSSSADKFDKVVIKPGQTNFITWRTFE